MSSTNVKVGDQPIYDAKSLGTGKIAVLGIQHVFAMFGATVLVPLLTGLSVSTTLLWAGLMLIPDASKYRKYPQGRKSLVVYYQKFHIYF